MSRMYSYAFTWDELTFKLFGKKRCPKCGGKMKYFYKEHYVGKGTTELGHLISGGQDDYRRDIWYRCLKCNKEYSLQELMTDREQRKKDKMVAEKNKSRILNVKDDFTRKNNEGE